MTLPLFAQKVRPIRLLILDVDGVLTDGRLYYEANGESVKVFHVLDGQGIRLLQQTGVAIAIITARNSPMVAKRASDLGIAHLMQGVHDKSEAFDTLLAQTGLSAEQCAYMGDDIIDLPVLTRAGFAISVPNGHPEVMSRVDHITRASGGQGAVREACDLIMRLQNTYDAILAKYLT